ncbi:hypothetical protein Bca101_056689 [Brassica carinata]
MVNRRDSMGSEESQFREWNSMGTIKKLNPFDPVAKERTESRSCGDICRILFQRKVWYWFQLVVFYQFDKKISSYLIGLWFMIFRIIQRIFGFDLKDFLQKAFWKEEEYKKTEVSRTQSITVSNTFLFLILLVNGFWFFCLFIMTQSQLIGKSENKKTAENVIKKLKISVPHFDNSELIKGYSRTLIGRCMNPSKQDVKLLITMLPKIWKVEDRVVGADLGLGRFQFDFEQEADIEEVLKMQPFHFDYWMLSLVRWQPRVERNYPYEIRFWVRVLGVPLQLWAIPTFENIGGAIGKVIEVDIDYGRVKVVVDGFKNLVFETEVEFHGGEHYEADELPISLRYEKVFGYCRACFSLCHDIHKCPLSTEAPEKKLECQEDTDVKHGERVASYKDYQGKGKGKMYAEEDSKWVNVSEKRLGKNISSRGRYRGEERDSSFRSSFRGRARFAPQEDRFSDSPSQGVRRERERSPRENFHYRERSTSRRSGTGRNGRHEQTEQTNLLDHKEKEGSLGIRSTNAAEKKETNVELLPAEDSLDLANEVLEAMNLKEGVEGMEVDGEVASEGGVQKTTDAEDGFQDLTDEEGEVKGDSVIDSVTGGATAGDKESKEEGESENGVVEGKMVKKQSTKKKAVKSGTVVAGGTTKKRMVQAMMLQGKRTAAKNSSNPDEGSKKMEEKGSLNPKPSSMK